MHDALQRSFQLVERERAHTGEAAISALALIQLGEHARERAELLGGQLYVAALVGQRHEARAVALDTGEVEAAPRIIEQIEQHRQQVHAMAVDLDAELEVEPSIALVA